MSWRDKGWNNPHKLPSDWFIYEAGADAILEALKSTGSPISNIKTWNDIMSQKKLISIRYCELRGKQVGWLVFIEEENEKDTDKKEN